MKLIVNETEALKHFNLDALAHPSEVEQKATQIAEELEGGTPEFATELPRLTEEEQEALYEEAATINAALEELTARKEAIKSIFRRLDYGTATVHRTAGGQVTIGHNPVFNEARFLVTFPYDHVEVRKVIEQDRRGRDIVVDREVYPNRELYKITPDRTAMKRILGDDVYKEFFDEGEKKVTIK